MTPQRPTIAPEQPLRGNPRQDRRQAIRQTDLRRALAAAAQAGLTVESIELSPKGAVRLLTSRVGDGTALDDGDWVALAGETTDHGRA